MSELAEGIYFDLPREGAPDFVKGKVSINLKQAGKFLKDNMNEKGYINLDLLVSKGGKPYVKLNEWQPEESKKEEEFDDDIPF